ILRGFFAIISNLPFPLFYKGILDFGVCYNWLHFAPKSTTHIQNGYTISPFKAMRRDIVAQGRPTRRASEREPLPGRSTSGRRDHDAALAIRSIAQRRLHPTPTARSGAFRAAAGQTGRAAAAMAVCRGRASRKSPRTKRRLKIPHSVGRALRLRPAG